MIIEKSEERDILPEELRRARSAGAGIRGNRRRKKKK
jgi:hypothetical protein